jgi:hypothetical protein
MNKKIATEPKLPAQFYIFASSLAFGTICMILTFAGGGLLSPALALSQSPALLAVCIAALSFYSEKSKSGFFRAAFLLFAFYFAFLLGTGNLLALLPLAASLALSFAAKDGFGNARFSTVSSVSAVASAIASAVFEAMISMSALFAKAEDAEEALRQTLGGLFASKLSLAGYLAFAIAPIIFFVAVTVHIRKQK